jgi:hypothetical protein
MQQNNPGHAGQWQSHLDGQMTMSPLAARVVPFRTAIHRSFTVEVPLNVAWSHLTNIEGWPSWARHLKRVELNPPGPLTDRTQGVLRVRQGGKIPFRTTEFRFLRHWTWRGHAYGVEVEYCHRFEAVSEQRTQIIFTVGHRGSGLMGKIFTALYARNLDKAIPLLIAEMNARSGMRYH